GDQRDTAVDGPGDLPGVGEDRLEAPAELGGHVEKRVEAHAGLGLVEDDGDVPVGQAEAAEDGQVPAQVHEARPVRRGQGEDVVADLESGGEHVAEALV